MPELNDFKIGDRVVVERHEHAWGDPCDCKPIFNGKRGTVTYIETELPGEPWPIEVRLDGVPSENNVFAPGELRKLEDRDGA